MKPTDIYYKLHKALKAAKALLIICVLGLVYLFIFQRFGIGIPCVFRLLTGIKCPGCGMTHAISAISNGNFAEAMQYNALSLTIMPIIMVYLLYRWVREQRSKGESFAIWEIFLLIVLFFIVITYGVVRNMTWLI